MSDVKLVESKQVRSHWDAEKGTWYFSVIDVIEILTGSSIPKRYWSDLKKKLTKEGSQLYEKIVQLKFEAADGKKYATDCLDTPNLLRLIQSIPSPKAEPFKQWLAKVGYERMQEIADPSQGLDRARENWQKLGRSEKWIQQRMTGQETRNKLTDYWKETRINRRATMPTLRSHTHLQAILELAPHFLILTNFANCVANWKNESLIKALVYNNVSTIHLYGVNNPIQSSYELLWREIKEWENNSGITIQHILRRILENYFQHFRKQTR